MDTTGKILITGSTGFIGGAVTRVLSERGHAVRLLLRPSAVITHLPIPEAETVVASLQDERGLRSALRGVRTVVHLASAESARRRRDLFTVDVEGTRRLLTQAKESGVERLVYLSHLGADRGSAFLFLQAKGIAENAILESGIPALILRASMVFGAEDTFTNVLAMLARVMPAVFLVPEVDTQLQPLWVEDLAACVDYCLAEDRHFGEILSIGGPEHLTFQQVVEAVLNEIRVQRIIMRGWPPLMRLGAWLMDGTLPHSPITPFWLDYLSVNRTCEANSLSRLFGLIPARLADQIGYLRTGRGLRQLIRFSTRGKQVFLDEVGREIAARERKNRSRTP
jgi:uncharacterized protein YbjT (DUF2867 family)